MARFRRLVYLQNDKRRPHSSHRWPGTLANPGMMSSNMGGESSTSAVVRTGQESSGQTMPEVPLNEDVIECMNSLRYLAKGPLRQNAHEA